MKIKLFIVTYKNNNTLDQCLNSLYSSVIPDGVILEIYVINNHSNFVISEKFEHIKVLHNTLRPDFSTGHLARNWNQAIITGFKNLHSPDCNFVVTCQVDTIFTSNWVEKLIGYHQKYCLVTACPGDGFVSYTPDAILRIGLWDERFCSIEYQEADYFARALIFNKEWSSINDFHHTRVLNPVLSGETDCSFVYRAGTDYETHKLSTIWGNKLYQLLQRKYSKNPTIWSPNDPPQLIVKSIMTYPYFESDVMNVESKYEW